MMNHIAIADDHMEMRVALRLLLNFSEKIEIICEATNGQEAVDCVKRLKPDVLVMDVNMPVLNGFQATQQIVELLLPTHVILMSTDLGKFMVQHAREVGAKGFISKDNLAVSLLSAIEAVSRGEVFFVEEG